MWKYVVFEEYFIYFGFLRVRFIHEVSNVFSQLDIY